MYSATQMLRLLRDPQRYAEWLPVSGAAAGVALLHWSALVKQLMYSPTHLLSPPACTVSPQVTDYSGSVTVINNAAGSVEIDGVLVNLVDTMGDGDTLAEVFADCPLGDSGAVGPVSGSSTVTIPAYGRLSCRFTLRAGASGALVGTATVVDGVEALVSKQWPVTSLMADSTCGQLLSGIGGSELGKEGVLFAEGGVSEEEVCAGSSKRISLKIPADASTDRGCKFPVSAGL